MPSFIRIFFLASCLFFSLAYANSIEKPLSVLVIGGGPAGLATAIEAHNYGARVTIIEQREEHSRPQRVFLVPSSISLLEKWNADIPNMYLCDFGEFGVYGFLQINQLENGLEKRVKDLGIEIFHGQFGGLLNGQAYIDTVGGVHILDYDIIVGADGAHSQMRKSLGIDIECFGTAEGAWAFVNFENNDGITDVSYFYIESDHYIKKITMPFGSVIFCQSFFNLPYLFDEISQDLLAADAMHRGWDKEAQLIKEGQFKKSNNIHISLQQAKAFSDVSQKAILIGDAAACGSFFHGNGVNTALKSAVIAGNFFKEFSQSKLNAFDTFNASMKQITDELIDYSRPLLNPDTTQSFAG